MKEVSSHGAMVFFVIYSQVGVAYRVECTELDFGDSSVPLLPVPTRHSRASAGTQVGQQRTAEKTKRAKETNGSATPTNRASVEGSNDNRMLVTSYILACRQSSYIHVFLLLL